MKRIVLLLLIIILATSAHANEVTPRYPSVLPELSFEGNIAKCSVYLLTTNDTDYIEATIQLWHGGRCIATWFAEGYGNIRYTREKEVTRGETYKLVVQVYINEKAQPPVSVTGTCE